MNRRFTPAGLLVCILFVLPGPRAQAAEIVVYSSIAARGALERIGPEFERSTSGKAGPATQTFIRALGTPSARAHMQALGLQPEQRLFAASVSSPPLMPLLFSYGTLRRRDVQLATFGRELQGWPDVLPCYELEQVTVHDPRFVAESGQAVHASLRRAGRSDSRVGGMVLEVTDAELAAADRYEARADYRRMRVTLASGREAWVYAAAGDPSP